ncbi:MAG TPA: 3-hydroxyacyl-ACP dehydratase [Gammaproteobacteria bacterium]|jgi:3-hydroxymyristoyl/3-hydroxydecanoyl-(acyl carrier protein) dehydratase
MKGLPKLLARRDADGRTELDLEVQPDNAWFAGHFPQFAILPGVVQIGWAAHFTRELHGLGPGVSGMEQVKFKRPILPGMRIMLTLKPDAGARRVRYEYQDAESSYSSGVLQFGETP